MLLTSVFIMVMILVFLAYKEYAYTDQQKVVETRINTINDFIKSIESDSKRVIYISGFRSLIALEDYVARSGQYFNNMSDIEDHFRVAFYNGTVNGTAVDILTNSSYKEYLSRLKVIADKVGIDIDINVTGITLYHDSPWSVNVIVSTNVNLTDQRGVAKWEFDKNYTTSVSIINIRDPVYSVSTYGRAPNTIRISNFTDFVNATNDTTNLSYHVNNSYYMANSLAPDFLMRLEGNFSNSTHGIESFVYIPKLIDQVVNYNTTKSIVDYVLFSNITGYETKACNVQNMPSWFKIDINHTQAPSPNYIESLNYTLC
jgi:hypothetical protein